MNSQIDILIKKLCPNGVEKVKLGEIGQHQTQRNRKHVTENAYSITQAGLMPTKDFFKEKTHITSEDTSGYIVVQHNWFVYSPSRVDVGSIDYLKEEGPVIVSPIDVVFSVDEDKVIPQYLFVYLLSHNGKRDMLSYREGVEGTGRRSLPFKDIAKMQIPLPPLAIQQEIVNILDKFTSLIDKIDEEINLRQKQYEYYREKLLTFKEGECEWKKLGDCCNSISSGKCSEKLEEGLYPVYGSTGIIAYTNNYVYGKEMVLIARVGANAGFVHIAKGKYDVTDNTLIIDLKENENLKFIYYTLINRGLNQYAKGGGQPLVTGRDIKELKFGFPSKTQQHTIVHTLDKFETLIGKLKEERALRQKQYEYYRERLLAF